MDSRQVIIVGGGIAGLTSAIHLSKCGYSVTLIEKVAYPRHKVCGEYISNEVLPYLDWLEIDVASLDPAHISTLELSTVSGKILKTKLPLGGFGVSRFAFDNLLFQKAIENGCTIIQDSVTDISYSNDGFSVSLSANKTLLATIVIGAYGKKSNIDYKLDRSYLKKKSPWLAVKAHYEGEFPENIVALHNFDGGYCGVSKVESKILNICYLASYESFKDYRNIEEFQAQVLNKNPYLKTIFSNSRILFDKPLTIGQISFENKLPVENHILMTGDTAGLINPLCGNGMAMAIHSAKIAAELIAEFFNGTLSRQELEQKYIKQWNYNFKSRIRMGRHLSALLRKPILSNIMMGALSAFPSLLMIIIKFTHGKPFNMKHHES